MKSINQLNVQLQGIWSHKSNEWINTKTCWLWLVRNRNFRRSKLNIGMWKYIQSDVTCRNIKHACTVLFFMRCYISERSQREWCSLDSMKLIFHKTLPAHLVCSSCFQCMNSFAVCKSFRFQIMCSFFSVIHAEQLYSFLLIWTGIETAGGVILPFFLWIVLLSV